MVKKTIILLVLYFFAGLPYQFAGKRIFCQGAGAGQSRVFLAPWSRSRSKKNTRSRSRLGKKSGAGAAKKFAGIPTLRMVSVYFLCVARNIHREHIYSHRHVLMEVQSINGIEASNIYQGREYGGGIYRDIYMIS